MSTVKSIINRRRIVMRMGVKKEKEKERKATKYNYYNINIIMN